MKTDNTRGLLLALGADVATGFGEARGAGTAAPLT